MTIVSDVLMCQLNGIFRSIFDFFVNAAVFVLCDNFYFLSNVFAFVVCDKLDNISDNTAIVLSDKYNFFLNAMVK